MRETVNFGNSGFKVSVSAKILQPCHPEPRMRYTDPHPSEGPLHGELSVAISEFWRGNSSRQTGEVGFAGVFRLGHSPSLKMTLETRAYALAQHDRNEKSLDRQG